MRYIWIISYIYQIPSAILYPQKVLRPSPSPDPRTSYVFPPPALGLESLELQSQNLKLFYWGSV